MEWVLWVRGEVERQSRIESEFPSFRQAHACHFRREASALGCPKEGGFFSGSCFAVAGVGALVGGQSWFEIEFPPSVACRRHLPPRGTAFSGPCFAVAGIGGEVVGSLFMKASLPSLSLRDISPPKGETIFYL